MPRSLVNLYALFLRRKGGGGSAGNSGPPGPSSSSVAGGSKKSRTPPGSNAPSVSATDVSSSTSPLGSSLTLSTSVSKADSEVVTAAGKAARSRRRNLHSDSTSRSSSATPLNRSQQDLLGVRSEEYPCNFYVESTSSSLRLRESKSLSCEHIPVRSTLVEQIDVIDRANRRRRRQGGSNNNNSRKGSQRRNPWQVLLGAASAAAVGAAAAGSFTNITEQLEADLKATQDYLWKTPDENVIIIISFTYET